MSANKKISPISTALSLLCSDNLVLTAPIVAGAILSNNTSSLWFIWAAAITGVVAWVFFATLWPRLPLQVENDFLRYRFGGRGAKVLLYFRSILIGFAIVPFFISWLILTSQRILGELFGLESLLVTGILLAIPLMLIPFNTIFARIRQDSNIFLIIALSLFSASVFLFIEYEPAETISLLKQNGLSTDVFHFPKETQNDLWFYFLFFWWIAYLPDLPDIDGQKLMKTTEPGNALATMGFMRIGLLIVQIPLIYLALVAGSRSLPGNNGEQSIYHFLSLSSNFTLRILFGVSWMLSIGLLIMNKIRWGADVISGLVDDWKKQVENKQGEHILVPASILIYVIGVFFWTQTTNLRDSIGLLIGIGVGVAPVYFLRWFWWRINSWAQLAAMISALVNELFIRYMTTASPLFHEKLNTLARSLSLSSLNTEYLISGVAVTITWLVVLFLTPRETEETLQRFESTVKPGGVWKNIVPGNYKLAQRIPSFLFLATGIVLFQGIIINVYSMGWSQIILTISIAVITLLIGWNLLKRNK